MSYPGVAVTTVGGVTIVTGLALRGRNTALQGGGCLGVQPFGPAAKTAVWRLVRRGPRRIWPPGAGLWR